MSFHSSSFALVLLSSVALLASGCGQSAQEWPGAGQGGTGVATESPMAMSDEQPMSMTPVQETVVVTDPALVQRMNRLENQVGSLDANVSGLESDVAGLQTDMTRAKPQLAKIDSMERHFRQLSLELDRIDNTYGVAPMPAAKPVLSAPKPAEKIAPKSKPVEAKPLPPVSEKKATPAKAAKGPLKVQQVRVGEQAGGKTRIVLDTTAPAKISYDIDNGEKILLIEVPDASWGAQQAQTLRNAGLVSSYKAESDASGSRLIVQLKGPAQIVGTSRLDPSKDAGHRVFLDLAKK